MKRYELPLLRALSQLGRSARVAQVREAVEAMLEDQLTHLDRQPLQSGEPRWQNRLGFVRLRAIEHGHLRSNSQRSIWELTDASIERLGELEAEARELNGTASSALGEEAEK